MRGSATRCSSGEDPRTAAIAERWRHAATSASASGRCAEYQLDELAFVLAHVDDVDTACARTARW
jgi:hypothetical protein